MREIDHALYGMFVRDGRGTEYKVRETMGNIVDLAVLEDGVYKGKHYITTQTEFSKGRFKEITVEELGTEDTHDCSKCKYKLVYMAAKLLGGKKWTSK